MNTTTLAQWLHNKGYAAGPEAEDIWIGQALTEETALQIRRMVNRLYLDSLGLGILGDWVEWKSKYDTRFLMLMQDLIDAGAGYDPKWQKALYDTMSIEDLKAIVRTLEGK